MRSEYAVLTGVGIAASPLAVIGLVFYWDEIRDLLPEFPSASADSDGPVRGSVLPGQPVPGNVVLPINHNLFNALQMVAFHDDHADLQTKINQSQDGLRELARSLGQDTVCVEALRSGVDGLQLELDTVHDAYIRLANEQGGKLYDYQVAAYKAETARIKGLIFAELTAIQNTITFNMTGRFCA